MRSKQNFKQMCPEDQMLLFQKLGYGGTNKNKYFSQIRSCGGYIWKSTTSAREQEAKLAAVGSVSCAALSSRHTRFIYGHTALKTNTNIGIMKPGSTPAQISDAIGRIAACWDDFSKALICIYRAKGCAKSSGSFRRGRSLWIPRYVYGTVRMQMAR